MKVDLTEKQIEAILYAVGNFTQGDWRDTGLSDKKEAVSMLNRLKTVEKRLSFFSK